VGMADDEVLCQSVEMVVRVVCDHSSVNFFIHPNSVFFDSSEASLSIVLSFDEKLSLLCIGNTTVGPSSLGF